MREGLWQTPFPGQPAYLLPPIAYSGDGPAGFKHDPGTALSTAQRGCFFLSEFPSGKMRAFRISRDGASFRPEPAQLVHEGLMAIGLGWHPDGSLMVVDWIGGYPLDGLGAVWCATTSALSPQRAETQQLLAAGFAKRTVPELRVLLGHADQRVRLGAQLELARLAEKAALLEVARDPGAPLLARVHALWGYGQLLRASKASPKEVLPFLREDDPELRAQTLRILGESPVEGKLLIPSLADENPRVRLHAALALGRLRVPAAVEALFTLAENDAGVPVLRHAAVTGLTGCATAEQLAAKSTHPSVAMRLVSVVALRRQGSPLVRAFLSDAENAVAEEAARAIHDDLSIPDALPQLAAVKLKSESAMRRVINANLRLGTSESASRLLGIALDNDAPRVWREEALTSLRLWSAPPPLDRVDGRARSLQPAPIASVLTPQLDALLAIADPGLKRLAIEILIAHELEARPAQIAATVADAAAAASLRAEALRLLAKKSRADAAFEQALDTALAPKSPAPLHRAALEVLLPEKPERLAAEAGALLPTGTIPDRQHAIALLARAAHPAADVHLRRLGDELLAGALNPELQLDVLEALTARAATVEQLHNQVQAYSATARGTGHSELLAGGNVENGRDVVQNHLGANCLACHALDAGGSEVGPNLRTIGSQRDRAYLLESILHPAAQIAPGYGFISITLRDQTQVSGTLLEETASDVKVRLPDGALKTITIREIATRTPPISIMPPMLGILQPREIRDVVAYLSSLTAKRTGAAK